MTSSRAIVLVAALAVCGAAALTQVGAQAPATTPRATGKIGVCDIVYVFNNYQRAKDLSEEFNAKREKIAKEDDARVKAIDDIRKLLGPEGLTPGSEEYLAKLNEMEKLTLYRAAWRKLEEQKAAREHRMLTETMYRDLLKVVADVGREGGYDLVLYKENIDIASQTTTELLNKIAQLKCLYANDAVDLTNVVLSRADRQYQRTK